VLEVNISLNIFLRVLDITISFDAEISDETAIIAAIPLDLAVALPPESIVIIDSSDEDHSTLILSIRLLSLSNPRA
jgi:hypothetical protein